MTNLLIRIHGFNARAMPDNVQVSAPVIIARTSKLLGPDDKPPEAPEHQEVVVAVDGEPHLVEVSPGLWGVEVALPSGELVSRQARVAEGDEREVEFDLGTAPRSWLDWQYLEGSVPERREYRAVLAGHAQSILQSPRGVSFKRGVQVQFRDRQRLQKILGTPIIETDAFTSATQGTIRAGPRRFLSQVSVLQSIRPAHDALQPNDASLKAALRYWRALGSALRLDISIDEVPGFSRDTDIGFTLDEQDRWHQVWRPNRLPGDDVRRFAMAVTNHGIEMLSLPLPWPANGPAHTRKLIELMIDQSDVQRPSGTSLTIGDPKLFGLLGYLKNGALALAASVAAGGPDIENTLIETLQEKRQNPLAAAAAGYALLAATDLRKKAHWHDWIRNLAIWFPYPDGPLLLGRLLLARGESMDEARDHFLTAFARGLPYYSLGLDWLLEGLRQFGNDKMCIKAARAVRDCSVRSDVSQLFTVLRFHKPAQSVAELEGKG